MTARNYDVILTVANPAGFISGNSIIGATSSTVGFIANVNATTKQLKVKLNHNEVLIKHYIDIVKNHLPEEEVKEDTKEEVKEAKK